MGNELRERVTPTRVREEGRRGVRFLWSEHKVERWGKHQRHAPLAAAEPYQLRFLCQGVKHARRIARHARGQHIGLEQLGGHAVAQQGFQGLLKGLGVVSLPSHALPRRKKER